MHFEEDTLRQQGSVDEVRAARGLTKLLLRTGIVRTRRAAIRVLVFFVIAALVVSAGALYRSTHSAQSYGNYDEFRERMLNNQ